MICYLCGKEILDERKEGSVDHIVPQALYKWYGAYEKYLPDDCRNKRDEIKAIIYDPENTKVVHHKCNVKKGEKGEFFRVEYPALVKEAYAAYQHMKINLIDRQDYTCVGCGCAISKPDHKAVRRIDKTLERTEDNAVVLCRLCSRNWHKIRTEYQSHVLA